MGNNKKVIIIGLAVLVAAAVAGKVLFRRPPAQPEPPPLPAPAAPENAGLPLPKKAPAPATPLDLEHGDDLFREKAAGLSNHPKLADWLKSEDIIRRFVAAVDTVSDGNSPRDSLKFLAPKKKFSAKKKGGKLCADPRSYARYDLVAEVFGSLDAQAAARLVQELAPVLQAASDELGQPKRNFQGAAVRAIKELLRTPVVERDIPLREKVLCYAIMPEEDVNLEELGFAQKHLLRMGPKNTVKVQAKLREIGRALGVPDDQLPQARVYAAQ